MTKSQDSVNTGQSEYVRSVVFLFLFVLFVYLFNLFLLLSLTPKRNRWTLPKEHVGRQESLYQDPTLCWKVLHKHWCHPLLLFQYYEGSDEERGRGGGGGVRRGAKALNNVYKPRLWYILSGRSRDPKIERFYVKYIVKPVGDQALSGDDVCLVYTTAAAICFKNTSEDLPCTYYW